MTRGDRGPPLARASLALIGLAWIVPFLQPYHRFPLTAFYSEWLAFALGLAAALLLLRKESWREATLPWIAFAPCGLILVLALQVALGRVPYPEQALTAVLYLLWAMLLMVLAHTLRRELGMARVTETLAWYALAGGVLAVLAGLLQHYEFSTPLDSLVARKNGPSVHGNLGQPNHYAAHVTLALAAASYLYARGLLHGALAAPCVALLLLVIALSGSRSPWLFLGALIVLALLVRRRRNDGASRRLVIFVLSLLPAFALAQYMATLPLLQPEHGAVVTSLQRVFGSASGIDARLQLWREAWQMFCDAPLLGAGFGQFAWHHFVLSPPAHAAAAPGVFNHAHNIVLHLMAETGVAGASLVVGAAIFWLAGLRRVALDLDWWWLLAVLAVMTVHAMLEYPLWYSYFLGLAAILLGLGATQAVPFRKARLGRFAAAAALALGWLNLVSIIAPYRDFERLVFDTRRAAPHPDEPAYAAEIMRLHREPLLRPYVELALTFGITVSREGLREKLELNARAMRFAPIDAVAYTHALLLDLSGEHEAARRQLELAVRAYPAELEQFCTALAQLARRYPGEFTALLELAAAKGAELRARAAPQ
jgi:O-antigen ligase